MAPNRIVELASMIAENTRKVDDYLTSQGLPTPSFDASYPVRVPLPLEIQSSQASVLEASDELTALMYSPLDILIRRNPFNAWSSIQAIERFGIAKTFPPGQTSTFEAIANSCTLPVSDLRRILRHAMTYYIFQESSPGIISHTAASKALAQMPTFANCMGFLSNEMWPASARLTDAMKKWPGSEEPNETGFAIANDTDVPMFDAIGRDPERAKRMAGAMSFLHTGPGFSIQHVIENFDWNEAAQGLLVDVGGGHGTIARELVQAMPGMRCIVQDLPHVIEGAEVPEHDERLQFMAHNFFHEQPVKGADIYLLRWILHDWSDKYAIKILQNLIPALKKGCRLLVIDQCLPIPGVLPPFKERIARTYDLAMKAMQNAKERDADDWSFLFGSADARFKLQEIRKPENSILSTICVVWEGEVASEGLQ